MFDITLNTPLHLLMFLCLTTMILELWFEELDFVADFLPASLDFLKLGLFLSKPLPALLALGLHLLLILKVQFSNLSISRLKVVTQLITLLLLANQSWAHIDELFEQVEVFFVKFGQFFELGIWTLFDRSNHLFQVLRLILLPIINLKLVFPEPIDLHIDHLDDFIVCFLRLALTLRDAEWHFQVVHIGGWLSLYCSCCGTLGLVNLRLDLLLLFDQIFLLSLESRHAMLKCIFLCLQSLQLAIDVVKKLHQLIAFRFFFQLLFLLRLTLLALLKFPVIVFAAYGPTTRWRVRLGWIRLIFDSFLAIICAIRRSRLVDEVWKNDTVFVKDFARF